jgi:hypothetical protein
MSVSFELHKTYNFNTLAPSILGTNYKNITVLGILSYDTAIKYFVPETVSVSVYPHLPNGTPSDPKRYTYLLFQTEAGITSIIALEWIDKPTIVVVSYQTINISVLQASAGDTEKIRESLVLLGFTNFTMNTV